jgi:hypothetical protein
MIVNGFQWLLVVVNGCQWLSMVAARLHLLEQFSRLQALKMVFF